MALSGGIDSAVAALLLKGHGYKVEGVYMRNWDSSIETNPTCDETDYHSAQRIASTLEIPLHRVNFVRSYWQNVFTPVLNGYNNGVTPNPDVMCNREIKFGSLWRWTNQNGFSHLATGHYSRIIKHQGQFYIGQATNLDKDQSYFLASVPQKILSQVIFPIGEISSKPEVRRIAESNNLQFLLDRPESMGLCFVGKRRRFASFISDFISSRPGNIVHIESGELLGRHGGIENYTLGQHLGLGGMSTRLFVVRKSLEDATIYVSPNR